ncbi:hypothetical protein [Bombilactobacillus thymidiniphilus]|uniref:hypothetical protein n=1 Tax=Bombilactobacillus thymidiniphilus TaxID=2923363 RepID=UPI0037BEDBEE
MFVPQKTNASLTCVSQGHPFAAFELSIRDQTGNKLPEGYIGLIHLAGPSIASSYISPAEKRAICELDGSFNTLDIGFMYQGQLYITGRQKEMIIANGENFFLQDLDNFLTSISELRNLTLASVNFNYDDQDHIVVLVEDKESFENNKKDFEKIIYSQASRQFKVEITKVLFVPQILKTATGKIMRQANCDLYLAKGGGSKN